MNDITENNNTRSGEILNNDKIPDNLGGIPSVPEDCNTIIDDEYKYFLDNLLSSMKRNILSWLGNTPKKTFGRKKVDFSLELNKISINFVSSDIDINTFVSEGNSIFILINKLNLLFSNKNGFKKIENLERKIDKTFSFLNKMDIYIDNFLNNVDSILTSIEKYRLYLPKELILLIDDYRLLNDNENFNDKVHILLEIFYNIFKITKSNILPILNILMDLFILLEKLNSKKEKLNIESCNISDILNNKNLGNIDLTEIRIFFAVYANLLQDIKSYKFGAILINPKLLDSELLLNIDTVSFNKFIDSRVKLEVDNLDIEIKDIILRIVLDNFHFFAGKEIIYYNALFDYLTNCSVEKLTSIDLYFEDVNKRHSQKLKNEEDYIFLFENNLEDKYFIEDYNLTMFVIDILKKEIKIEKILELDIEKLSYLKKLNIKDIEKIIEAIDLLVVGIDEYEKSISSESKESLIQETSESNPLKPKKEKTRGEPGVVDKIEKNYSDNIPINPYDKYLYDIINTENIEDIERVALSIDNALRHLFDNKKVTSSIKNKKTFGTGTGCYANSIRKCMGTPYYRNNGEDSLSYLKRVVIPNISIDTKYKKDHLVINIIPSGVFIFDYLDSIPNIVEKLNENEKVDLSGLKQLYEERLKYIYENILGFKIVDL